MNTLSNNFNAPILEPKGKADSLYVVAMVLTVIVLFAFAYYDQIAVSLFGN
ncbi:hypothetical protein [Mucilaginibacter terrae]|uniref:Uncharacterized protein n=1 Tax=Mucilaginibacter terrae TaxID=1955052 RepID=A0ABU3GZA0_9SPHI|nr:hypothetical protein [Mucilaginibacter terrae]MDT3404000.1 hypothetical protein [Mucilaginibacter terrae]